LTLDPGTYGVSVIWAGDGRTGPNYPGVSAARSYTDPETGQSYKYPSRIISEKYSDKACRWNGSYKIRTKVCL